MQYRSTALVFAFAMMSCASGFGVDRFLDSPKSQLHTTEDALHMWAVADMELREGKKEELEGNDAVVDAKAIKQEAVAEAKVEEARAKKELKGKDLEAALAVSHDEEARKNRDAKQIEDIAAKEEKNAADTEKEAAKVKQDATDRFLGASKSVVHAKEDALQMWAVADLELKEGKAEELQARNDESDAKAIKEVAVDQAKADDARAKKELKGKDLEAALAVAHDDEVRKEKDAKQIEDIAAKEKKDSAITEEDAAQVKHDAAEIEVNVMPPKKATKPSK
jgi:hypothetical protein